MTIDPESHLLLHRLQEHERDRYRDQAARAAGVAQITASNSSRLRQQLLRLGRASQGDRRHLTAPSARSA